jgi:mersacidin/lichenicidin family type 2 lantibiotic
MKFDIVRAWKDETYHQSLSNEQLNQLPASPAGEIELADAELESIYGSNLGWGGALAGASAFSNGGFGFGNFNRFQLSNSCSRNCSFGCDIRQDF